MSRHRWFRRLPEWVVADGRDGLQADVVAGLTTGAVILPKAMAYQRFLMLWRTDSSSAEFSTFSSANPLDCLYGRTERRSPVEFGRPVNVNSLVYKHFKPILKRAGLPEHQTL